MANNSKQESLQQEISRLQEALTKAIAQEATLEKRLQQFEFAARGANDGLWDFDLLSGDIFVSEPGKSILGYKDKKLIRDPNIWEKYLHPEDHKRISSLFQHHIDSDKAVYDMEFRMRHQNNSYRWIRSSGKITRDQNGQAIRISGSYSDITERKKSEDALIASERKFRNLFENSLVGMVRTSKAGKILEANKTAFKLFGVKELPDTNALNFYEDPSEREKLLKEINETGRVENKEIHFKRKNGTFFWGNISAKFFREEDFIEAVVTDITNTKETLLELKKVNLELDNFVYHASHDLRSPLRSILGLVSILRLGKMTKEQKNCTELIEGSIERMDKLVKDLLSISRNSRISDPYESLNFLVEINNSITNFFHDSRNKHLVFNIKVYQLVEFISDLTRIRIILNNLISNAIKYRSYKRELSCINIEVHVNKVKAQIVIEDNGEGIPAAKMPVIFNMFVRASERSEGSGLGLYIVKDVIEKLNGKIEFSSEENKGTTINLEIPNGDMSRVKKEIY